MRINFHFTSNDGEDLRTVTRINIKDLPQDDDYGVDKCAFEGTLGRIAFDEVGRRIEWDGGTVYCIVRPENGENMTAYVIHPAKIQTWLDENGLMGFTRADIRYFSEFWNTCDVPFLPSRGRKVN